MKVWKAIIFCKKGDPDSGTRSICTLGGANNSEEAVGEAIDELTKNPSRLPFFNRWVDDGKMVEEVEI